MEEQIHFLKRNILKIMEVDKQTAQVEGQGKSLPLLDGLLGAPRPIAPDPRCGGGGWCFRMQTLSYPLESTCLTSSPGDSGP